MKPISLKMTKNMFIACRNGDDWDGASEYFNDVYNRCVQLEGKRCTKH